MTESLDRARARRRSLAEAMASLEDAAARPGVSNGWAQGVRSAVEEVRASLVEHIHEVEADDGLLIEVLETAPRLAGAIKELESEHVNLLDQCDTIITMISSPDAEPAMVRRRVLGFLGHLTRHRQHGADLVYEAYNVDISSID